MPINAVPAREAAQIEKRVGQLMPQRQDYWWELSETDNVEAVAEELDRTYRDSILPFLGEFPNRAALKAHFEKQFGEECFFYSDAWHLCQLLAFEGNEKNLKVRLLDLARKSREERDTEIMIEERERELLALLRKSRS